MKKSVIVIICVIYVLAIVIVGFLGMRLKVYNENIYVNKIECTATGYKKYETDSEKFSKDGFNGYIIKEYKPDLRIEIKCQIFPENATSKNLKFFANGQNDPDRLFELIDNKDGTVTIAFKEATTVILHVESTDTKHASIVIEVIALEY